MASYAIKAGTLTQATALAFRDLCEVVAMRQDMMATLSRDGLMVDGQAHPLLAHERQYRMREEQGRVRFMLAPIGKPMQQAEAAPVDPFAEFEREAKPS